MSEPEVSIQSMALQKRTTEQALMPPPPPPKRLKRPPKTLDEDTYTSAITSIIERDFFPELDNMRSQMRYLSAVEEGNPVRIADAARRLSTNIGGGGMQETMEERKERKVKEDVRGLRLDGFQAKYTSEDNESFNALLDQQNEKTREKYAWRFQGNKQLTKQEFLIEQKRVLLLEQGKEGQVMGERNPDEQNWSKEVETWKWTPLNILMNPHPGLDEPPPDPSDGQKLIQHKNTRISPATPHPSARSAAPSPSVSTVQ